MSCVTFILNSAAGLARKLEVCQGLVDLFSDNPFRARVMVAASGAEIPMLVQQAIAEKSDAIVAGGGDGTVSAVASALVGTNIPLGILPLGNLNQFARDLHVPTDIEAAARSLLIGHIAHVDVGEVNGRVFLNTASVGINPAALCGTGRLPWARPANWAAWIGALGSTMRSHPFLRVRIPGAPTVRGTPFLLVANERHASPFPGGWRVHVNSRQLCLWLYRDVGRWELLHLAARGLFRGATIAEDMEMLAAAEFSAESSRKYLRVLLDGESYWMLPPLQCSIRREALRVIVPARQARVA
jgi:diacylglycerol kinase family enzyme